MARPLVLAAALVLGAPSALAGGRTSKVTIETDPPGAKVYLNVKEDGEVCTTPCTIDAPIGETPIIVEAENRRSIIENLVVPRKTARPMRVSYKLKPAVGSLVITGGNGAAILIDEQNQGTAPHRFDEILAGAHHIVLEKNGRKIYDAFVEIEIGREATVQTPVIEVATTAEDSAAPAVTAPGPARSDATRVDRLPRVAVHAATDIGFRQFDFSYADPSKAPTQRNDRESGQVLAGAIIELWPTRLFDLGVLRGLAIYGRFQFGVNPQRVTARDPMTGQITDTSLSTAWRSIEVSVRHRWMIGDMGTVEAGAGFLSDSYRFTSNDTVDGPGELAVVPDAKYKAVRIGGRVSLIDGRYEPYFAAENPLVISGGVLENRFPRGSVNGVHGALGSELHLGMIDVRAQFSVTQYSWSFPRDTASSDQATGGSDLIEQIGIAVGYTY